METMVEYAAYKLQQQMDWEDLNNKTMKSASW